MRVGLDFDGVFVDVARLKRAALRDMYGLDVPSHSLHKHTILNKKLLNQEQYNALNDTVFQLPKESMSAVRNMNIYFKKLYDEGYELEIVTLRRGRGLEIAQEWLLHRGINIPMHGVREGDNKRKLVEENQYDIFVDDDLYKLEPLCGIVEHRLLFTWPYNRGIEESSFVKRVAGWKELYKEIILLNNLYISRGLPKAGSLKPSMV